jgi:hypothetical protein
MLLNISDVSLRTMNIEIKHEEDIAQELLMHGVRWRCAVATGNK